MSMKKLTGRKLIILIAFLFCLNFFGVTVYAQTYDCAKGKHKDIVTVEIPATATEDGKQKHTCQLCTRSFNQTIYATDHLWGKWKTEKAATCTNEGVRIRTCTRAETHDETEKIEPLGHKYVESIEKATCTENGLKTLKCSRCDTVKTETLPAFGAHTYVSQITQEARCEAEGAESFTCSLCEDFYNKPIPKLEHDYGEWIIDVPAAEGLEGKQHKECKNNCNIPIEEIIPPLPLTITPIIEQVEEKKFPIVETAIISANFGFLMLFAVLIISDVNLIVWEKNIRQKNRERLERDKYEFS